MTLLNKATKVVLEGHGTLTLRPGDHIATGGEGSVYRVKNRVVKLYSDAAKMTRDGMREKIKLLAALQHPFIVSPECLVTDELSRTIGYAMPFVEGEALPRIFTNDWRTRENFTDKDAITLIARMREATIATHSHKIVQVDANELNILMVRAKDGSPEPHYIDVDAWALGKWPASVIMPSIRDHSSHSFNEASDWFSWAIVTFQVMTGIHPYKGTLPGFAGNFIERMKANKSVFEPDVRLNRAVRDFSCIPPALLDWYIATFKDGERTTPPSPFDQKKIARAATTLRIVVKNGTEVLRLERLLQNGGDAIIRIYPCGLALRKSGDLIDIGGLRVIARGIKPDAEAINAPHGWLIAHRDNKEIKALHVNKTSLAQVPCSLSIALRKLVRVRNRLFAITDSGLTEVTCQWFGKPLLGPSKTWPALTESLNWFDGIGVQDALGAKFITLPYEGDEGMESYAVVRAPFLDGVTPVSGVGGPRSAVIIVLGKDGSYKRITCLFDGGYTSCTHQIDDVDGSELNCTILSRGVAVTLAEDGKMSVLVPTNGQAREVTDHRISSGWMLGECNTRLCAIEDGALWGLSLS